MNAAPKPDTRFAREVVHVREKPGAEFRARCNGQVGSCTSDAQTAARRAAAKWFARVAAANAWPAPSESQITLAKSYAGSFFASVNLPQPPAPKPQTPN